ncbi:MAG: hypothetical protein U0556_00170 [Dehalococcoidia bacterium]
MIVYGQPMQVDFDVSGNSTMDWSSNITETDSAPGSTALCMSMLPQGHRSSRLISALT